MTITKEQRAELKALPKDDRSAFPAATVSALLADLEEAEAAREAEHEDDQGVIDRQAQESIRLSEELAATRKQLEEAQASAARGRELIQGVRNAINRHKPFLGGAVLDKSLSAAMAVLTLTTDTALQSAIAEAVDADRKNLREVIDSAASEWAQYVEVDSAPRTLRVHLMAAFDAALAAKEGK